MREIVTLLFLGVGAFFMLLGAIGILRMPDLYNRMQATSKTSSLGVGLMLLAVVVHFFDDLAIVSRALLVIVFTFLTTPVGAQMIARAAHFVGVPMWQTTINELEGQYDLRTHELQSYLPPASQAAVPPAE